MMFFVFIITILITTQKAYADDPLPLPATSALTAQDEANAANLSKEISQIANGQNTNSSITGYKGASFDQGSFYDTKTGSIISNFAGNNPNLTNAIITGAGGLLIPGGGAAVAGYVAPSITKVAAGPVKQQPEEIFCFKTTVGIPTDVSIPGCIAITSYFILYLTSWVLFVAAVAFDWTIQWSLSMYGIINSFQAIQYGWETLRNVINLFFILILVYIAIATILRIENYGYKKLLSKLVLAVFLINFSMFFTKIIIDASNITALVFYKQIMIDAQKAGAGATTGGLGSSSAAGATNQWLSFGIMNSLGLSSVWGVAQSSGGSGLMGPGSSGTISNNPAVDAGNLLATSTGVPKVTDPWTMTLVGLGGSVFVLILAFVFFATTIMLLLRVVALILLIITSPAAFAAGVLPKTSKWSDKWWSHLTNNALFAPVYMMLLFVTLKMIWGGSTRVNTSLLALFTNSDSSAIQAIIFFVLLCSMLIACLTVATSFGTMGSKMVGGWGKSMGGKATDWTKKYAKSRAFAPVSYLADKASKSQFLSRVPGGGIILQNADKLAQAKVGGSSYRSRVEADKKTYKTRGDLIKNANTGELMRKVGETEAQFKDRKSRQENSGKEAHKKYFGIDLEDGTRKSNFIYKGKSQAREDIMEANSKLKEDQSGKIIKQTKEAMAKTVNTELIEAVRGLSAADADMIKKHIENKMTTKEVDDGAGNKRKILDVDNKDKKMENDEWFALLERIEEPMKRVAKEVRINEDKMVTLMDNNRTANDSDKKKNDLEYEALRVKTDMLKSRITNVGNIRTKIETGVKRIEDTEIQKGTKAAIEKNVPPPTAK